MRRTLGTLLMGVLVVLVTHAQGDTATDNLLTNPGFEATETRMMPAGADATFTIPSGWTGWYTESPRTEDWQNQPPNGELSADRARNGVQSMTLYRANGTFTAALYQTVEVPTGARVNASAWYALDVGPDGRSQARLGIDPAGGDNPFAITVIWSAWGGGSLSGDFAELTTSADATGEQVTVFLFTTQTAPSERNRIYWDDAALTTTTASTEADAETTPPAIPPTLAPTSVPVSAQTANPDGSLVHQVVPGQTAEAIAAAYDITLERLLDLNPALGDGTRIQGGQLLTIVPAPQADVPQAITRPPATFTPAAATAIAQAEDTTATACIMVYEDQNGNQFKDVDEPYMAGGMILLEQNGQTVEQATTDADDAPTCFSALPAADYVALVTPPEGYTLTSNARRPLALSSGGRITVGFGVAPQSMIPALPGRNLAPEDQAAPRQPDNDNPPELHLTLQQIGLVMVGIAGAGLLLGLGFVGIIRLRTQG